MFKSSTFIFCLSTNLHIVKKGLLTFMIYSLSGTVTEKSSDYIVISCAGVGYYVSVPQRINAQLSPIGKDATIYTVMNVTENDVALFGFDDIESRKMFLLLTSVSGVGPKAGLAILSALNCAQIALALSSANYKAFTAANGVGPKLAQRIVLELKDKVGKGLVQSDTSGIQSGEFASAASDVSQAMAALMALGYTAGEANAALANIDTTLPTAEIIRLALQNIGKRG